MLTIPQVDLGRVNSADGQSALVNACSDVGMFRAVGHGISTDTLNEAMAAHEVLFSIDAVELAEIPIQPGGFTRGFVPLGAESGSATRLECKNAFSYGWEWDPDTAPSNPLQGPNKWPRSLGPASQTRSALGTWFNESVKHQAPCRPA